MDLLDDDHTKNDLDANKDSILHYACRGGNCEVQISVREAKSTCYRA